MITTEGFEVLFFCRCGSTAVATQLFWMLPEPIDVFFDRPGNVVLWSVAHAFLDPGDIHVSTRSVARAMPGLQTDLGIGDHRFHCLDKLAVRHRPLAADVVY